METLETVLIVVHLLVVVALVAVVLLQRSEGGALGMGGGGGGNFMSGRGQANALSRATGFLALGFFITSISLTVLAQTGAGPASILDQIPDAQPTTPGGSTLLYQLGGQVGSEAPVVDAAPADGVPAGGAPAVEAPIAPGDPQIPRSQ